MNKKTILISSGVLLLAVFAFFLVRGRFAPKANSSEVIAFLEKFNIDVKVGNNDTLMKYFESKKNAKKAVKLFGLLSGQTDLSGKHKGLFNVALLPDNSDIAIINSEQINSTVPVLFSSSGVADKQTTVTIKLRKVSAGNFKIIQIDARDFAKDFLAYESGLNPAAEEQRMAIAYSPITLEAFKTAAQLKSRYDSVLWFAHVDKRSYFYVVKGKWEIDNVDRRNNGEVVDAYKMGLVNPDQKEIIPVDYDLVYNIGGTFPDLVEVEKNNKHGFYDLGGKLVIPVNYDQVFPLEDEENLAVLRNGNDYFYLKHDMSISEKVEVKVSDILPKIKNLRGSFTIDTTSVAAATEFNSHELHGAVYIAPSYLADLEMVDRIKILKNPLRAGSYDEVETTSYNIIFDDKHHEPDNWLSAAFYSIADNFLGGRSNLYVRKNVVIVDKKHNRLLGKDIREDYGEEEGDDEFVSGVCYVNSVRAINDSLFEVKAGAVLSADLYDTTKTIVSGPYYHYLAIRNNKLIELPQTRNFGFTKYVKMDDSYLNACYELHTGSYEEGKTKNKAIDHVTPEMLRYMKNEIYADYRYQFKDSRWQRIFGQMRSYGYHNGVAIPYNVSVDDSLTAIDRYNITWITNKLKPAGQNKVLAAK